MVLNATIFQFVAAVSFVGEETPEDPVILISSQSIFALFS
jgi:hypothetical protein